jgi:cellulose synthase/poly-beta-1,6-N-acetylglucosamine synthase-like glycosyltransferase
VPPSSDDTLDAQVFKLLRENPAECALETLTRPQKWGLLGFLLLSAVFLWLDAVTYLLLLNGLAILLYVGHSLYKFYLVWVALGRPVEIQVTADDVQGLDDDSLPRYTLLVPLYRETEVLAQLTSALCALDYPSDRLQVILLLEEDDTATIEHCRGLSLPPNFELFIVPDGPPKTKPKACNYGLWRATGDLLVIYDAEDIPEPDQLKKAVAAFRRVDERVICLQAKLNYYNQRQNLLTKWFTMEYSMWFDLFLPGLTASRAPIPLGGTSNHFKTDRLRELGGWDPFNVTEDCDLGVRLHKHGYLTAVFDSTTWEEANSRLRSWIRQRSRWIKGYVQTYIVHSRHPLRLFRELGPAGFVSFQLTVGGTAACLLLNPIYWAGTVLWFGARPAIIASLFPLPVWILGSLCLILGNFVFIYMGVAGCLRRGYYDLVRVALLAPAYWVLMSIGAWKAALQLLVRPHYWEKTTHGLFERHLAGKEGGGGEPGA